jgi:hypothetical protein
MLTKQWNMDYIAYKFLSAFFRNMIFAYVLLYLERYFLLYPFVVAQYLYIVPFCLLFHSAFEFRMSMPPDSPFVVNANRALAAGFFSMMLSPFFYWWLSFPEKTYFLYSLHAFMFFLSVFLFNVAGITRTAASLVESPRLILCAKFARIFILYGLIAPLFAFFLACWIVEIEGDDVYFAANNFSVWIKLPLFFPVFFLSGLSDLVRHLLEKRFLRNDKTV